MKPGTASMSGGPLPATWYAIDTPPLFAYFVGGDSMSAPHTRAGRRERRAGDERRARAVEEHQRPCRLARDRVTVARCDRDAVDAHAVRVQRRRAACGVALER